MLSSTLTPTKFLCGRFVVYEERIFSKIGLAMLLHPSKLLTYKMLAIIVNLKCDADMKM